MSASRFAHVWGSKARRRRFVSGIGPFPASVSVSFNSTSPEYEPEDLTQQSQRRQPGLSKRFAAAAERGSGGRGGNPGQSLVFSRWSIVKSGHAASIRNHGGERVNVCSVFCGFAQDTSPPTPLNRIKRESNSVRRGEVYKLPPQNKGNIWSDIQIGLKWSDILTISS